MQIQRFYKGYVAMYCSVTGKGAPIMVVLMLVAVVDVSGSLCHKSYEVNSSGWIFHSS